MRCAKCQKLFKPEKPNQTTCTACSQPQGPTELKVMCAKCKYKFKIKKGSRVNPSCPYCGGTQLMKDQVSSDELLKQVDGFD